MAVLFTAGARAADPVLNVDLGGGVTMELALIPSGGYMQGSPASEPGRSDDEAQRFVQLSSDYYIGKTAVTRAQWERFATETGYRTEAESGPSGGFGWDGGALAQKKEFTWRNPGFPQDGTHPVCIVTYPDAEAFCQWLSQKAGRKVALPTEAQWEYACRAGYTTAWHLESDDVASSDGIAWHKGNAGNATHPANAAKPNAWGLHIGGNVAEWCQDWYAPYESGPITDPVQTNQNLSDKPRRVLRGGSWNRDAKNTRSAARFRSDARSRNADIGFRVVAATVLLPVGAPMPASTNSSSATGSELPRALPDGDHGDGGHVAVVSQTKEGTWFDALVGFVCCLGLPGLIIVGAIYLIVKKVGQKSGSAGGPATGPTGKAMADALSRPTVMKGAPKIRIADDGFWLLIDAAQNSLIEYIFRPKGGMESGGKVNYQPGPEGQFIYTGLRPASVRILRAGGVPMSGVSASDSDSRMDDDSSSLQDDDRNTPPRYPSAY